MDQGSIASMGAARRMAVVEEAVAAVRAAPDRTVPALRAIRRRFSAKLKHAGGEDVRMIGSTLVRVGQRWMGYEIIAAHPEAMSGLTLEEVQALGQGMASWEETDTFAVLIAGAAWLDGAIADRDVKRWAEARDLWWRRAALVATTVLNSKSRGGGGDAKRTLAICALLVEDREEMVVKALSWALRSLAPWDAPAVEAFLRKHDERLAPRVKREVAAKLRTGVKSPRKAASADRGEKPARAGRSRGST